jgi:prolyl-tRNA synthetase
MVIKPYGYAIWKKCKQSSIECLRNWASKCLFPLFVPMFEAEEKMQRICERMRIVTHYRLKNDPDKPGKLMVDPNAKLEEELIVRPTSEAIINI